MHTRNIGIIINNHREWENRYIDSLLTNIRNEFFINDFRY